MLGLSKKAEFHKLIKFGRKFHKKDFSAIAYLERGADNFLIKTAYAVLKKNFPKAVTRNRIKRRLRAVLRSLVSGSKDLPQATVFLKVTPSINIVQTSLQQLYSELKEVLTYVMDKEISELPRPRCARACNDGGTTNQSI